MLVEKAGLSDFTANNFNNFTYIFYRLPIEASLIASFNFIFTGCAIYKYYVC